jgi:hypothetical protein
MEDVMRKVGIITEILRVNQGGKYVFTKCLLENNSKKFGLDLLIFVSSASFYRI